jgi:hypothetical protein
MLYFVSFVFAVSVTGAYLLIMMLPIYNFKKYFYLSSFLKLFLGASLFLFVVPNFLYILFAHLLIETIPLVTSSALSVAQIPVVIVTLLFSPSYLREELLKEFPNLQWKNVILFSLPIFIIPLLLTSLVYVSHQKDTFTIKTSILDPELQIDTKKLMDSIVQPELLSPEIQKLAPTPILPIHFFLKTRLSDVSKSYSNKGGSRTSYRDAVLSLVVQGTKTIDLLEVSMGEFYQVDRISDLAIFFCKRGIPTENTLLYPETENHAKFSEEFNQRTKSAGCESSF